MTAERITTLFTRYMDGIASEAERLELSALSLKVENSQLIKELEETYWEKMKAGDEAITEEEVENLMQKIGLIPTAKLRSLNWRKLAVAASILLVISLGSYFLFVNKSKSKQDLVKVNPATKDIEAPAFTKAMITLADGRTVSIDSLTSITQGNVKVEKTADGKVVYSGSASDVTYNTLSNPRGSKVIDMTLADGSHVWLNAGSSVTYPIAFTGNERKVNITGEAYFEISHDKSKPFVVSKGDLNVQVLGTHFNVNAYDDETEIKVTLLEGSVKVNNKVILKPGQQAQITSDIHVQSNINVEEVMAWKNGKFDFGEGTNLQTIMRQVARWYDVEIVYAGTINQEFGGSISRDVSIVKVLNKFELTGKIKFDIEGRKVTVTRTP